MRPTWQTTTTNWLASVDAVPGGSHNRRFWTARQRPRQGSAGVELIWAAGPESQLYLIVARAISPSCGCLAPQEWEPWDLRSWTLVSRYNGDGGTTG
jgi:hypothetical protein